MTRKWRTHWVCWPSSVTNTPTLGATKPGRKFTSVVLIL